MASLGKQIADEVKTRLYKNTPVWVVSSAKGLYKDIKAKNKSKKDLKDVQSKLVIERAQKRYEDKYWEKMTPSRMADSRKSFFRDSKAEEYRKIKKEEEENLNK